MRILRHAATAGALAALGLGGWALSRKPPHPAAAVTGMAYTATVTTEAVAMRPLRGVVPASGTVIPWREVVVGAETGGLAVTRLAVDEGDRVEAGQVLATLSDGVLRAQVDQQKASVTQAEATLDTARSQARNAAALAPIRAISREESEQRQAALRTAEAKREAAAASLVEAETRLSQTHIAAPVAGTVSKRSIAAGAIAPVGAEFFRIIQDDRVEVEALVPEGDIARVLPGQPATVTPPAGKAIAGSVRLVTPSVDARTRLGIVRIALPAGSPLRPGMFARVEIVAEDAPVASLPLRSLIWREGRPHAFRVDGTGTAHLVPVVTGRQSGAYVEAVSGLVPGERVAAAGAGFLSDGDRVRTEVAEAGR